MSMVLNLIISQVLSCIIDDGLMTMVVIDDGTMLGVRGGVVYKKLGRRQVIYIYLIKDPMGIWC